MMILQGNIPPLDLLFGPLRPSCQTGGSVLLVSGYIPLALSTSEGAGSVWILVHLPGAHLFTQVLGNKNPTVATVPPLYSLPGVAPILSAKHAKEPFRNDT